MGQVVVVGSINADYVVRIGHLPRPGETVADGYLDIRPGGKGANQAHAAARLGASVVMIGAVGTDVAGQQERAALDLAGVAISTLTQCSGPSGVAVILVDAAGENMIAVAPGANRQPSGEAVTAGLNGRIDAGSVVLASLEIPLDAAVLGAGARAVIVTRGADGASLYEPGEPGFHLPAPQVAVVDTVGAGDAFNGALAVALADGEALRSSVRKAVTAGAAACTGPGARGALPTRADVAALLAGRG